MNYFLTLFDKKNNRFCNPAVPNLGYARLSQGVHEICLPQWRKNVKFDELCKTLRFGSTYTMYYGIKSEKLQSHI